MIFRLNLKSLTLSVPVPQETKTEPFKIRKHHWIGILLILASVSIGSWYFYYRQGLTLSYNDARSHLNVARRVIDSLQPGAAQIGSVWLPLYHVLEIPFVANDFLWHSGIAGSIVSMASFILGGIYLALICQSLKFDKFATLISLSIYALNPNLVFLQSTPMTESLLISLTLASSYHLIRWTQGLNSIELVLSAFFTFLSTLTRYDGWFLMLYIAAIIAIIALKKKGYKYAEGNVFLYCTLAGFGIFLWILWNTTIFGDPFYFATGEFSAKAQQDILLAEGRLLTKNNIIYSFFVYLFATRYNLGTWISFIFLISLWVLYKSKRFDTNTKLGISVLLSPFLFNVLSLFAGHSVIHLPELPPYTWFNDRYGLMLLPAASILLGIVASGRKAAAIFIAAILLLQTQSMYVGNRIITIEDGVRGASGEFLDEAGNWIRDNIKDDGLILVAASSNDALLFRSGLPLKRFILEGARKYWDESIQDPTKHAAWIVTHRNDLVDKALRNNPNFLTNYRLVYHDDFSYIYKREIGTSHPITKDQLPR